MDYEQFWRLADATRGQPERAEALAKLLEPLDPNEIVRFRILYDDMMQQANRVDLRGAGATINGGDSDDGFYDFREGLIELGRPVFEAAVRDPDSLADVITPGQPVKGTEGLADAPINAWTAKTGESEGAFFEAVDAADTRADRGDPEEGEWWNFADRAEVRHRLPRLAAKCLKGEEE